MTMRAKHYQNFAALLIFMRRTIPIEPIEPAEPLSQTIKVRYASWAAPEPDNPSHKTLTNSAYPRRSFYAIIVHSLTQMMKSSIKSSFIAYQTEISFDLPLKIPQFAPLMKGQSRKGIDTRLLDRAISNLY